MTKKRFKSSKKLYLYLRLRSLIENAYQRLLTYEILNKANYQQISTQYYPKYKAFEVPQVLPKFNNSLANHLDGKPNVLFSPVKKKDLHNLRIHESDFDLRLRFETRKLDINERVEKLEKREKKLEKSLDTPRYTSPRIRFSIPVKKKVKVEITKAPSTQTKLTKSFEISKTVKESEFSIKTNFEEKKAGSRISIAGFVVNPKAYFKSTSTLIHSKSNNSFDQSSSEIDVTKSLDLQSVYPKAVFKPQKMVIQQLLKKEARGRKNILKNPTEVGKKALKELRRQVGVCGMEKSKINSYYTEPKILSLIAERGKLNVGGVREAIAIGKVEFMGYLKFPERIDLGPLVTKKTLDYRIIGMGPFIGIEFAEIKSAVSQEIMAAGQPQEMNPFKNGKKDAENLLKQKIKWSDPIKVKCISPHIDMKHLPKSASQIVGIFDLSEMVTFPKKKQYANGVRYAFNEVNDTNFLILHENDSVFFNIND